MKSKMAISTAPLPTSTPPRFVATPQLEDRLRRASPPPPGEKGVRDNMQFHALISCIFMNLFFKI